MNPEPRVWLNTHEQRISTQQGIQGERTAYVPEASLTEATERFRAALDVVSMHHDISTGALDMLWEAIN